MDFTKYMTLLVILCSIPVAIFLNWLGKKTIYEMFILPNQREKAAREALAKRNGERQKVRVRMTDKEEELNREDRYKRQRAEDLIRQGFHLEAAQLLESIKFQRRAIEILENAGLLDEAAEILMRLNAPNRAGVIFERNNQMDKAAHYYSLAMQYDKAGEMYLKLAESDYRYFKKAATAFREAGNTDDMLECLAKILQTDDIVASCIEKGRYSFLAQYLADPVAALYAIGQMKDEDIKKMVDSLPITPHSAHLCNNWVRQLDFSTLEGAVLKKMSHEQKINDHFWMISTKAVRKKLIGNLKRNHDAIGQEIVEQHAQALRRNGEYAYAVELFQTINDSRNTAHTLIDADKLVTCKKWLEEIGLKNHADDFAKLIGNQESGFSKETREQARKIAERLPTRKHNRPHQLNPDAPKAVKPFFIEEPDNKAS